MKKKIIQLFRIIYKYSGLKFIFVTVGLHRFVTLIPEDYKQRGIQFSKETDRENKKIRLAKGLDEESRRVITLTIDRYLYVATHNFYPSSSAAERREQKRIENTWKRVDTKDSYYRHINMFLHYYHRGLKLLDEAVTRNVEQYLKNKDVIDAGAYTGDSALMFKREYAVNRVFAFEPEESNYRVLEHNIRTNNWRDIVPIKKGLGNKINEKLQITAGGMGATTAIPELLAPNTSPQTIELTTIDNFVETEKITVGLIKMDIEGSEPAAIEGAIGTIKRLRPVLLIAIYHGAKDFFDIKPYLEEKNINYQFYVRKTGGHPVAGVLLLGIPKELL